VASSGSRVALSQHLCLSFHSLLLSWSRCFREGTIRSGDRIVSIDGIDTTRCSLLRASSLLTCRATAPANRRVVLVVDYDVIVNGRFLPFKGGIPRRRRRHRREDPRRLARHAYILATM